MNFKRPLILASSSPRRQFLMREVGFQFSVQAPDIDESFPPDMPVEKVPAFLAERKARAIGVNLDHQVVVASDTIVILEGKILNKPSDRMDAIRMLSMLSGKTHRVITAVYLLSKTNSDSFDDCTEVTFRKISTPEIEVYIDHYHPLDKAGAYGAQDCLPPGMNPCSSEELEFLKQINKPQLLENTISHPKTGKGVVIIEKIKGSYFTVMGLPIHKVYGRLMEF